MRSFRSVVTRANQRLTIQLAAVLLAGSTLIGSAFGFYRDRVLNALYYDSYKVGLDAYTAAFTIPDFMFFILVSGALSVSFIPVLNQRLASGNRKSAWELSASLINFMALLTLAASFLIIIFADFLVTVVAPGLDETGHALAVSMMRVIAVNPFLFAIATVIASMQQAIGRFTFFAMAPTVYNIGIIIGALHFTSGIELFGVRVFDGGIMGVALGVVLGSAMQLVVSALGLIGLGFDYDFKIKWKNKGFRQVLRLLPSRSLDQGMDYLNNIVESNLASRMAEGTLRAYNQAMTLHMMPINLIGVAISTAAFPKMTEHLSHDRRDLFSAELRKMFRVIIWFALPVAIVAFFTRGYLVNLIKEGGDPLMARILGAFVVAILFRSIYHITARSFYAQQDTRTPFYISIVAIGLNITLAVWFTMSLKFGAEGLAWAQSVTAFVEVVILFTIMSKRIPGVFNATFWNAILRMASATGFMAIVSYILVSMFPLARADEGFFATLPKFTIILVGSAAAYIYVCHLFKLPESRPIVRRTMKYYKAVINR